MSCYICSRPPSSQQPKLYCPTCARNRLYKRRIAYAELLLDKESLEKQISHTAAARTDVKDLPECRQRESLGDNPSNNWCLESINSSKARSSVQRAALLDQISELKDEIKNKRAYISGRKSELAQRQSDAESARYQLSGRESAIATGVRNNSKRTEHLWHALHNKTAEARIYLCREAARLYGLRQKVRRRNGEPKETYVIGGVPIFDLREINGKSSHWTLMKNSATPAQISTVFSNIAHLLVLVSHYLSLRLPAEIILPHRDHPTPTIFGLAGSYLPHESSSQPTLSSSQNLDSKSHKHRPRPLYIDKSLSKLAKEDTANYTLFLEGATLLAWNLSWLCRTQGLSLASDSWEDVCDIGKNMWQLLVAPPAPEAALARAVAGRDVQTRVSSTRESPKTTINRTKSFAMLGHYSHGTVHSFLGAHEGTEFIRTWKLPSPTRVIDKLKSTLLGELASAEWELLETKEWKDEISEPHQPPLPLQVSPESQPASDLERGSELPGSPASTREIRPEAKNRDPNRALGDNSTSRPKGVNGWTKLKSRQ
ncbi:hypothetical protein ASPZODRAFT_152495 [Penicilliopsis zonata CBS 506.65]|uniref:Autophagy-related protein 14 n=1 Tax=Penicilliopsis zonata CBS 506.65 TaxID=1073090 RepID=A0A1L9SGY0_9EURO|nr:hypothetical protein ASPZODRAFT_152495 [Penicilliopsis zonata CBS 506.65]OJJ46314.1 hypothetical protein ASPZODRAFT_152495 [Penicilliopsis zonata CBS 506.65]